MTLADKRKVIEVLLCCGRNPYTYTETTMHTARVIGVAAAIDDEARKQWGITRLEFSGYRAEHGEVCITTAYRLIESSPTLRREWFGAR